MNFTQDSSSWNWKFHFSIVKHLSHKMSLAGLKKQLNKANQYLSETIGGAKGTELDAEFAEMERKLDVTEKLVTDLQARTQEYLQPNPATRARLMTMHTISKVRGQAHKSAYPQPEGLLGDCMVKNGKELGEDSVYGSALVEFGESLHQMADVKYALEDNVKQNFLDPLYNLQNKDLREVAHHRKKLQGRRLDYDHKAGRKDLREEEMRAAMEKFEESKELAETSMYNLLDNEVEQLSQLSALCQAQLAYHKQCSDILDRLNDVIQDKVQESNSRPTRPHVPKRVSSSLDVYGGSSNSINGGGTGSTRRPSGSTTPSAPTPPKKQACARALYDFEIENEGELAFAEGDLINLVARLDENWLEGELRGQRGFFPSNYVEVLVDL